MKTLNTKFILTLTCSALLLAGAAAQEKEAISPSGYEWADDYKMSPAVRVGSTVYLSGVTARPADESDQALQQSYERLFDEIGRILSSGGMTWANVVDMTSFHTDMQRQQAIFSTVRNRYITKKPYPAWTAIGVSRLWNRSAVTEVKIVAHVK